MFNAVEVLPRIIGTEKNSQVDMYHALMRIKDLLLHFPCTNTPDEIEFEAKLNTAIYDVNYMLEHIET